MRLVLKIESGLRICPSSPVSGGSLPDSRYVSSQRKLMLKLYCPTYQIFMSRNEPKKKKFPEQQLWKSVNHIWDRNSGDMYIDIYMKTYILCLEWCYN